jgi:hypothetical protein
MVSSKLEGQNGFSIDLVVKAEHVHSICSRLHIAHKAHDVEVLVVGLQEELGVRCSPVRICRQGESIKGLEELCEAEELLFQSEARPVDSLHEVPANLLEKGHYQLATHRLPLIGSILPPSQSLVLINVKER